MQPRQNLPLILHPCNPMPNIHECWMTETWRFEDCHDPTISHNHHELRFKRASSRRSIDVYRHICADEGPWLRWHHVVHVFRRCIYRQIYVNYIWSYIVRLCLLLRIWCTYAVGIHFHLHSHDFTGVASPSMHIAGFSFISFSLLLTCHCMICTFPDLWNGHFRVFWSWIPASISASSVEPLRTLSRCHFVIAQTQVSCQGVVLAEPIHAGSLQWGNDVE